MGKEKGVTKSVFGWAGFYKESCLCQLTVTVWSSGLISMAFGRFKGAYGKSFRLVIERPKCFEMQAFPLFLFVRRLEVPLQLPLNELA